MSQHAVVPDAERESDCVCVRQHRACSSQNPEARGHPLSRISTANSRSKNRVRKNGGHTFSCGSANTEPGAVATGFKTRSSQPRICNSLVHSDSVHTLFPRNGLTPGGDKECAGKLREPQPRLAHGLNIRSGCPASTGKRITPGFLQQSDKYLRRAL